MSLPTSLPAVILETILTHLATLFLTGAAGHTIAARQAAAQMLAAYNPENEAELRLAATVIGFSFHALEALSQATGPDMSLTRVLRLRGSAVSLSRESHKAQRKLDQLQQARRAGLGAPAEAPHAPSPSRIDDALGLIEAARDVIQTTSKTGGKTWSQALQKRLTAQRMAEKMKKNQADHARRTAHLEPPAPSAQPAAAA